jgi:hypothetical protein
MVGKYLSKLIFVGTTSGGAELRILSSLSSFCCMVECGVRMVQVEQVQWELAEEGMGGTRYPPHSAQIQLKSDTKLFINI